MNPCPWKPVALLAALIIMYAAIGCGGSPAKTYSDVYLIEPIAKYSWQILNNVRGLAYLAPHAPFAKSLCPSSPLLEDNFEICRREVR